MIISDTCFYDLTPFGSTHAAFFVLQFYAACDKLYLRHIRISPPCEGAFYHLVKMQLRLSHLCMWGDCVAAIGVMRFSVRGSGCALFLKAGEEKDGGFFQTTMLRRLRQNIDRQ